MKGSKENGEEWRRRRKSEEKEVGGGGGRRRRRREEEVEVEEEAGRAFEKGGGLELGHRRFGHLHTFSPSRLSINSDKTTPSSSTEEKRKIQNPAVND